MGTKFRWQLTASVLAAVAILFYVFIPVFADDAYPIWVGEKQLSASVTSGEGWEYQGNAAGGTLTLNNAVITESLHENAYIYSEVPLKIVLVGKNTIGKERYQDEDKVENGIRVEGDLEISGSGSLSSTGKTNGIEGLSNITITDTNVKAQGDYYSISLDEDSILTISGSKVETVARAYGVYGPPGSVVYIKNSEFSALIENSGIQAGSVYIQDGSKVNAEVGFTAVGAVNILSFEDSDVTLKGNSGYGMTAGEEIDVISGTVRVYGGYSVAFCTKDIIVDSNMVITTPAGGYVAADSFGQNRICNSNGSVAKDVVIEEADVKLYHNGSKDLVSLNKRMATEGETVTVTVKTTFYYLFRSITAIDANGHEVSLQDNSDGTYTFTKPAAAVSVTVVFNQPDVYPVWIGGQQMTSNDASGNGWTCKTDDKSVTLTLDGADIVSDAEAVKCDIPLTIILKGNSKLTTEDPNCINAASDLVIKGEGSLVLTGNIKGQKDITISDKAEINISKSENGIMGAGKLDIKDSKVTSNGITNAIYVNNGKVNISSGSTVVCNTDNNFGIYTGSLDLDNSSLTVNGKHGIQASSINIRSRSELSVTGKDICVRGDNFSSNNSKLNITSLSSEPALNFSGKIIFSGGTLEAKSLDKAVYSSAGQLDIGDSLIKIPENGVVSNDNKTILDSEDNAAKEVNIQGTYKVSINTNGSYSLYELNKSNALPGDEVKISILPDISYRYKFNSMTVTDVNGAELDLTDEGEDSYSFIMPACPVTVNILFDAAQVYTVWIDNFMVTSYCMSGEGWRCEVDENGATLYLKNLSVSSTASNAIDSQMPLTIVLEGKNTVEGYYNGIYCVSSITIKGKGSLIAKGKYGNGLMANTGVTICGGATVTADSQLGINSNSGTISISDSTVTCNGTQPALRVQYGSVSIKNSTVTCSSTNNFGINTGTLTIDNSTVVADTEQGEAGISVTKLSLINGSNLTSKGRTFGLSLSECSLSDSSLTAESENGYAMKFNKLVIDSGYFHAKSLYNALVNGSEITLADGMQILIPENGRISNDGTTVVDSSGVSANEVVIQGTFGVSVKSNYDNGLTSVDKGKACPGEKVTVTVKPDEQNTYRLTKLTVLDNKGNEISIDDEDNGVYSFTMPISPATVNVEFEKVIEYPVWIEKVKLTSFYTSGNGWSYDGDETGGTLTLENADLSVGNDTVIKSNLPLTIVLKGENKLSSDETGIYSTAPLEIKGEGSISICGYACIVNYGDLTISGGAAVKIDGTLYGILVNNGNCSITDSTVIAECVNNQGIAVTSNHFYISNSTVDLSGKYGLYARDLDISKGSKVTAACDSGCLVASSFTNTDSTIILNASNTAALAVHSMTVNSGTISASVDNDPNGKAIVFEYNPKELILGENMVIVTPENGKLDDDKTTILDADGNIAKIVVIKQNYKVTATAGDNGKAISSASSGIEGTTITLTATPDEGYIFKEWKVVKGGVKIADAKSATTTFTIGTADVEIKAIFAAKPTPAPQVTLKLDKKSASVICGKTTTIKATLTGSKDKVTWKSSDTKIATVDANGKVTTKMAGTVTITASAAGKKATCTVTVLYKDVTDSKEFWYAPTNYLTKNGIVKGYDNQTLFKPANECSRAQMVTFLWRLAGQPNPKKTTTDFKDIKTTDYFYKPVLWAVEMGITTGVSKTSFNPQGICTRAQTVTFLWRMAGKPAPKTKTSKFTDIGSKDYFYKATLWASEMKIVAGYDDNTFRPQGKCLRRQMVTFLYKYDKYVNGKG